MAFDIVALHCYVSSILIIKDKKCSHFEIPVYKPILTKSFRICKFNQFGFRKSLHFETKLLDSRVFLVTEHLTTGVRLSGLITVFLIRLSTNEQFFSLVMTWAAELILITYFKFNYRFYKMVW